MANQKSSDHDDFGAEITTENDGMVIITSNVPSSKRTIVRWDIYAGSMHEKRLAPEALPAGTGTGKENKGRKHTQSAAHFLEHIATYDANPLWKSDHERKLFFTRMRGTMKAQTEDDKTSLIANVSNSEENVSNTIRAFAASIQDAELKSETIKKEAGRILGERGMALNNFSNRALFLMNKMRYPHTPLAISSMGTPESINDIVNNPEILRDFRHQYTRNRMVLTVIGDVPHESVVKAVNEYINRTDTRNPLPSQSDIPSSESSPQAEAVGEAPPEQVRPHSEESQPGNAVSIKTENDNDKNERPENIVIVRDSKIDLRYHGGYKTENVTGYNHDEYENNLKTGEQKKDERQIAFHMFFPTEQNNFRDHCRDVLIADLLRDEFSESISGSYNPNAGASPVIGAPGIYISCQFEPQKAQEVIDGIIDAINNLPDHITDENLHSMVDNWMGYREDQFDDKKLRSEMISREWHKYRRLIDMETLKEAIDMPADQLRQDAKNMLSGHFSVVGYGQGVEKIPPDEYFVQKLAHTQRRIGPTGHIVYDDPRRVIDSSLPWLSDDFMNDLDQQKKAPRHLRDEDGLEKNIVAVQPTAAPGPSTQDTTEAVTGAQQDILPQARVASAAPVPPAPLRPKTNYWSPTTASAARTAGVAKKQSTIPKRENPGRG